ncbi:hypothetical protein CEJ86_27900 [Sinorhizobium meliloti]|uniref:Uncharacterized protein n=1 Tax=Rhizobium meliloti TaxID=382 RepID=A0A2J0YV15_RHIML|nr:hypothetical protein CEJ86_27900 [Sinorhizobium meliloti]
MSLRYSFLHGSQFSAQPFPRTAHTKVSRCEHGRRRSQADGHDLFADSDEAAPLFRDDCAPGFRDDLAPLRLGSCWL